MRVGGPSSSAVNQQAQAPAAPAQGGSDKMGEAVNKFMEQIMKDSFQEFDKITQKGFSEMEKKDKERQAEMKKG